MTEPRRADRVVERIREELTLALRNEVRDPRVTNVLVSRIEMPDDLQLAKVFIRLQPSFDGTDEATAKKNALRGLGAAAGMLRRLVGQRLGLRYAPELRFFYDENLEANSRIDELLLEIQRDRGSSLERRTRPDRAPRQRRRASQGARREAC